MQRALASVADWVGRALAIGRDCGAVRDDLPTSQHAELVFAVLQAMDRWSLQHMGEFDNAEITDWRGVNSTRCGGGRREGPFV